MRRGGVQRASDTGSGTELRGDGVAPVAPEGAVRDADADGGLQPGALERLAQQLAKFAYRPNLLIVDGGQPQVNAAAKALSDSGITDLAVCGLAKRLEEIWLPNQEFPVILPRATDELFLMQRIRDEAHRFAITYQKQKRSKGIASTLAEIPGLGDKRIAALLRTFGSVKRLKLATVDEIAEVASIGPALAREITSTLNP